jgi:cell division protein ZapA (FtsZ GTPase activity inhibitor)
MDYTITLTTTEQKSLEYITPDVDDYITNFSKERARLAKIEILSLLVAHCNANSVALAVGEDAQILQAYELGVVSAASSEIPSAGTLD